MHAAQTCYFCPPRCQHEFEANLPKYALAPKPDKV